MSTIQDDLQSRCCGSLGCQHLQDKALAEIARLRSALSAIVLFCDDPTGSEQPETLALGLARLLPDARAALNGDT